MVCVFMEVRLVVVLLDCITLGDTVVVVTVDSILLRGDLIVVEVLRLDVVVFVEPIVDFDAVVCFDEIAVVGVFVVDVCEICLVGVGLI